jgi:hypothetical protein
MSALSLDSAAASEPILDVAIGKDDRVADSSRFERSPEVNRVTVNSGEETAYLRGADAIVFPYEEMDPLFGQGPFTWMMRCKFENSFHPNPFVIAGRWDSNNNQRIIAFVIDAMLPKFLIAESGFLDGTVTSNSMSSELYEGDWLTIVGRYTPGRELAMKVYDSSGELMEERSVTSDLPEAILDAPIPFTIGSAGNATMDFSRLRVWNSALSDRELQTALEN